MRARNDDGGYPWPSRTSWHATDDYTGGVHGGTGSASTTSRAIDEPRGTVVLYDAQGEVLVVRPFGHVAGFRPVASWRWRSSR